MQDWMIAVGFIVMLLSPCFLASITSSNYGADKTA
jgi:hypothetical protein